MTRGRTRRFFGFVSSAALAAVGCSASHRVPVLDPGVAERPVDLPDRLRASVRVLSEEIGERNCYRPDRLARAADWIKEGLEADGYAVRREPFHVTGRSFACADQDVGNLIAELPGTSRPKEVVVIGAHYDSRVALASWHDHTHVLPDARGTPGANDNGSGVAAVLELARLLAKSPQPRTVRFCFWVNEEPPFYQTPGAMGSLVSASRSRAGGEDLSAVVVIDTVGCYSPQPTRKRNAVLDVVATSLGLPRTADYVAFLGTHPNEPLVARSADAFARRARIQVRTLVLPYVSPVVAWSDDWSYARQNYPSFCVTDTAFLRSDRYHEISDTADAMDFGPFADVVWGLDAVVRDLASL